MSYKYTCFIKPDLDTVVAAYLLRPRGLGQLCHLSEEAPDSFLDNRQILCIECGGSGRVEDSDFDHHGKYLLPCAAEQVWAFIGQPKVFSELVRYTACIDTGQAGNAGPHTGVGMTLSGLFSGLRIYHKNAVDQFWAGLALLREFCGQELSPADVMPLVRVSPTANSYFQARKRAGQALAAERKRIQLYTFRGYTVGALTSGLPGVHGLMRQAGADISVAGNKALAGDMQRWSISVRQGLEAIIIRMLPALEQMESGWGGPAGGGIICGPRKGSRLALAEILACVEMAITSLWILVEQ